MEEEEPELEGCPCGDPLCPGPWNPPLFPSKASEDLPSGNSSNNKETRMSERRRLIDELTTASAYLERRGEAEMQWNCLKAAQYLREVRAWSVLAGLFGAAIGVLVGAWL